MGLALNSRAWEWCWVGDECGGCGLYYVSMIELHDGLLPQSPYRNSRTLQKQDACTEAYIYPETKRSKRGFPIDASYSAMLAFSISTL
jgi:hypothetical protein